MAENAWQRCTSSVDQKGDAPAIRGHSKKVVDTTSPRQRTRSRQSHDRDEERNERQRREEQYQRWQAFKAKQRSEKHARLKQRLALQHELIAAQEELHCQRQLQEQQRQAQISEAKCQERRSMQEALTERGKIDLESERRETRTKRRAARTLASKLQQASLKPGDKQDGTEPAGIGRTLSIIASRTEHHRGQLSVVSSSDEENEERDDCSSLEEDGEEILPHQQDLCRIFGRKQAAYFLRPRIEPEQERVVVVPQSLRKLGGRAGVNTLWGTLREHSKVKLQKADSKIPQELKAAYTAFIRERMTKNKTAAKRGFFREEEIPDSEKLQDSIHHQQVQDIQRQVQLMYRAAMTNEDKAAVLLHNNPISDCNNVKGKEGPLRYHPSWMQDDSEEDEPSYKKWLRDVASPQLQLPSLEDPLSTTSTSKPQEDQTPEDIWDLLPNLPEKKVDKERPKKGLSFLTEAEATVPGQFRKRWQERRDPAGRFIPGQEMMTRASLDGSGDGQMKNSKQGLSKVRSSTAPLPSSYQSSGSQRKVQTARKDWQPLSLNALEDYKPAVYLLGQGDFAQGQEFMWKPIVANASGKYL